MRISDISSAGWAVIFPKDISQDVQEGLAPLLQYRRAQASRNHDHYYRTLDYFPGDTKQEFFRRYGIEVGTVHPDQLPYYILIIGDPETVPFEFQVELGTQYAVGRLDFLSSQDYWQYAQNVINCEQGQNHVRPDVTLFHAHHTDRRGVELIPEGFINDLAVNLLRMRDGWNINLINPGRKVDLGRLLRDGCAPALLFISSPGLFLPNGHPLQRENQGAILCQEWPGPGQGTDASHYFGREDLHDSSNFQGMIAFNIGNFSAGTSRTAPRKYLGNYVTQAPRSFVSSFSQRLLAHPNGGALAIIAHLDRSRILPPSLDLGRYFHIELLLRDLMSGSSVGRAMDRLRTRIAELSLELSKPQIERGRDSTHRIEWERIYTSQYIALGDPATGLAVRPVRSLRVFLSHATEDKPAVQGLYRKLQAEGFSPWLDEEELLPGQDWKLEIERAMRTSDAVVICLSRISTNKVGFVNSEIQRAQELGRKRPEGSIFIIPVKLDPCTIPDQLRNLHCDDVSSENGFYKLVKALKKIDT